MMWQAFKNQWQVFMLALSFFTRIPVKHQSIDLDSRLSRINRYFSLVGIFIGLLSGTIFYGASLVLPISAAVLLAMISSVLLTGGLHEDGLADICDGFGGGIDKEKKFAIMKESAIGTYGTLALVLALLFKYQLLLALAEHSTAIEHIEVVILYFVVSQALSRAVAGSISLSLTYARTIDSKMGQIVNTPQGIDAFLGILLGLLPLLFIDVTLAVALVVSMLVSRQVLLSLFRWQIGGYTGDCLGASQQITELVCYVILAAFLIPDGQLQPTLGHIL